jgi:hypothetical protein
VLAIPENLTGADGEDGRLVGMARLRLDWPSLGPVTPDTRHRLLVTLSPPDKVNEPATQLSTYAPLPDAHGLVQSGRAGGARLSQGLAL